MAASGQERVLANGGFAEHYGADPIGQSRSEAFVNLHGSHVLTPRAFLLAARPSPVICSLDALTIV